MPCGVYTPSSPIVRAGRRAAGRRRARATPRLHTVLVLLVLLANCVVARDSLLSDAAVAMYRGRYGEQATQRLNAWQDLVRAHSTAAERAKLERVNDFFNAIPWLSDEEHWGRRDYWATPLEMLGTNGGDCEDYSIAKYITLVKMGVDASRLRITYVRAPRLNQPHMVLAYYPRPDAEPLILDNLDGVIRGASLRRDLIPVYSFNARGLWATRGNGESRHMGAPGRLDGWRDVARRMQREGVDVSG